MSFKSLLNKTCTIQRRDVAAANSYNQTKGSFADLATGVACALQPQRTGNKELLVDNETVVSTHVLFLEVRDVTPQDQVVVDGVAYDILVVRGAGGRDHHLELDLRLVA